jgi:Ankyrin repeats (many copies)
MIYAAHYNKPQIIRYLHSIGCSIEQTGKNNDSALSRACYFKNYDSILELLNLGADINKKFDQYPLLISLLRGNSKLLEFLLEHGADYRILEDARNEGIMKTLPEELKIIIKRHKAFQARLGFLFFAKFSNGHICKLSQGILKEIAMFID